MNVYADTSFFISLYTPDSHTAEAESHFIKRPQLWLSPLHRVEWVHAITQQVFRKVLNAREAHQVLQQFDQDRACGLWKEIDLSDEVFERCILLARQHVPTLGVRTLDTLHVASALELNAEHFWTFDERQAKLAKTQGLKLLEAA